METFYLIIVILLGILAVSDLVVGVSNDAVNFLNSAIGSKAAPLKIILIIASLGVVIGATFSSGLMEVARKGIFHPDQFHFYEIMIIFLAVMVTDIILLDLFNTIALPTSTTVSIVFELLGAAVAISLVKIGHTNGESILDLGKYINSAKALAIITGILISVFIAFFTGTIIQYITRFIFTFNFRKKLKYLGSIYGGLAITAITYFILIKGAKGASFLSDEQVDWLMNNTMLIMLYSVIGWTLFLQLLLWLFKIDVLKVIVLVGTFALAMAFAGNDLVNFIGVPLAGLSSYQEYIRQGNDQFMMGALTQSVKAPTLLLLFAGIVMVLTLFMSKKAKSVTATEVNLGRQHEGEERFGSTAFSRTLVRAVMTLGSGLRFILPERIRQNVEERFTKGADVIRAEKSEDAPSFDLLRASVNLVLSSILIAFGTSLKLPLSTTYVTFMVAMGTSLSDRAWGRESAVYRVTGVFTVIGGWFITALTAFTVAAIFAYIIHLTGSIGVVLLVVLAIIFVIRTHKLFHRKASEKAERDAQIITEETLDGQSIIDKCSLTVADILKIIPGTLTKIMEYFATEDLRGLRRINREIRVVNQNVKFLQTNINNTIVKLQEDSVESGHYYVQVLDYLREMAHCLTFIVKPVQDHVDNHHKGMNEAQKEDMEQLLLNITHFYNNIMKVFETGKYTDIEGIIKEQQEILVQIEKFKKRQVKRIKQGESGTRNSLLYLSILEEIKNLLLYTGNLLKSQRDFIRFHKIYKDNLPEGK